MLKIYLVRHGQDEDNANGILNGRRDTKLTKIGVNQAKKLATKIKKSQIKIDKIYSSPLKRTFQTAKIISITLKLNKPTKLDGLVEREFGIMAGRPYSDIKKLCAPYIINAFGIDYFLKPKGAETFPQLLKRAEKVLEFISEHHKKNSNILLVTHGDFGKMLYAAYYEINWQKVLKMFHFDNSELLLLSKDSDPKISHVFKN